jgi:hypothetical protein
VSRPLIMKRLAPLLIALACSDSKEPAGPGPAPPVEPAPAPPLDRVEAITSGLERTCALRVGAVFCWELRDTEIPSPVAVASLPPMSAIEAGGHRVCAIGTAGELHCWGETRGEDPRGGVGSIEPTRIDLGRPVVQVSVGSKHICAITDRRELYCWGAGVDLLPRATPMREAAWIIGKVDAVEVGDGWMCYQRAGDRQCGGAAPDLGPLTRQQNIQTPGFVLGSCGIAADRRVVCRGTHGLTAPGGRPPGDKDATIEGLDEVVDLAVGQDQACAIRTDRSVWCWTESKPPRAIPLPGKARQIAAGIHHACALIEEDGAVLCWTATRDPVAVRRDKQPDAAPRDIPTIRAEAAIRRAQPAPADLAGTSWSTCLETDDVRPPCTECRYTARFAAGGRFTAEGRCAREGSPATTTTWTGQWKRDGDRVSIRESTGGERWTWDLTLAGGTLAGLRTVPGRNRNAFLVTALLEP